MAGAGIVGTVAVALAALPAPAQNRRRLRVRRTAVYRVVVRGHDDHAKGISRERTITVAG